MDFVVTTTSAAVAAVAALAAVHRHFAIAVGAADGLLLAGLPC